MDQTILDTLPNVNVISGPVKRIFTVPAWAK